MLLFTVLATLLCSSLVDAHLARVDSSDALKQCQGERDCSNPALEIDSQTFSPIIKASPPGEEELRLAVESKQSLAFPVHAGDYPVTWEITRHNDKCLWEIRSDGGGSVTFKEKLDGATTEDSYMSCGGKDPGTDYLQHDRSKPIPLDGNGILPETAICESKSIRMVDEKQVAAAEAQNPAPGEAPTELKSQEITNKGPDGTSTQPAADPTNNV
ncbi:hypothetical protein AAVH_31352 [Aphelenchoides avenae]|nr:hypothetical protein AAVH_31352 [Aphelenchus avenae]